MDVDDEYVYLLERFMTEDGDEAYNRQLQSAIEQSIHGTDGSAASNTNHVRTAALAISLGHFLGFRL